MPSQKNMQQLLSVCRTSVSAPLAVCCTELPNDVVCKIIVPLSKQPLVPTFCVLYVSPPLQKLSRMVTGESLPSMPSAQVILQRHTHRLQTQSPRQLESSEKKDSHVYEKSATPSLQEKPAVPSEHPPSKGFLQRRMVTETEARKH